ncbi:MAG: ABC transporter ATP-binding protein [Acutalibacteraceae bacterium]
MKLILHYLKKYKRLVFFDILSIFSFALVELGIPTIMAGIIDEGIALSDMEYIRRKGILLLVIAVVGGAGSILLGYCSTRIATNITRDIRNDIFAKAQEYSHFEYNQFGVASMITRTTNDAFQLMMFVNTLLRMALLTPVMFIVSLILTIRTSLTLTSVLGMAIPFILVGVIVIAKISFPLSMTQQKLMDKLNRIARENLTGVRVIRAFRKDEYESGRFRDTNEQYAAASRRLFKLMSSAQPLFFFLLNIAVLAIFWISSTKINTGDLQVGQLVAFLEYQFHAMFSIMLFSMVFVLYPRAEVSARRIEELLDAEPMVTDPENGVQETAQRGLVEFDHVTFVYPQSSEAILTDVSFTAKAGETVSFIGSTGSGKSTLIKLIPRLYDVTGGSVRVDGVDVREFSLAALRQRIGYVAQKALLFSGTIADNLRMGKPDATEEELRHAAEVAQAYTFIQQKPGGWDEPVSEGGANFSGGQKQRLSIARALVRRPEIYIFDDSFSALDFRTDAALRAALKKETADAVVLIVAQRVSSIMDATRIVVLDEGRVAGIGTHRQLLESCPVYREIAFSQLSEEELAQ